MTQRTPPRHRAGYAAAAAGAFLGLAGNAPAAVIYFTNPGVGAWSEPTNWDLGVAPVAGDDVRINNGGTAVIDDTTSAAALFVQLGTAAASLGNLRMTGGTLTTTSDVRVGGIGLTTVGGTGTFDQSGGAINLNGGNVNVAIGPQTVGVYNLSGGSIQVNSSNIIAVGNRGTGTINQTGGVIYVKGTTNNANAGLLNLGRNVANATAVGNVNLSGGTIAVANVRYGNGSNSAGSTNSFTLSGTGRLVTDAISVFANHNGTNLFNFNGGTLNAETISIPLTNAGGRLAPAAIDFVAGAAGSDISALPVDPIGITTFLGNNSYTQGPAGILEIDIAGPGSHDRVDIGGGTNAANADLAGLIAVNLLNGFDPALGSTFDVLAADAITSAALATGLTPSGHRFLPSVELGDDGRQVLRLTVAEVPEPGIVTIAGAAAIAFTRRPRRRQTP